MECCAGDQRDSRVRYGSGRQRCSEGKRSRKHRSVRFHLRDRGTRYESLRRNDIGESSGLWSVQGSIVTTDKASGDHIGSSYPSQLDFTWRRLETTAEDLSRTLQSADSARPDGYRGGSKGSGGLSGERLVFLCYRAQPCCRWRVDRLVS